MFMLPGWRTTKIIYASLAMAGLLVACGGEEGPPLAPAEVPLPDSGRPPLSQIDATVLQPVGGSCVDGDIKDCKVLLPAHGSIHPCFIGVQICTGGKWGQCVERPDGGGAEQDGSAVN